MPKTAHITTSTFYPSPWERGQAGVFLGLVYVRFPSYPSSCPKSYTYDAWGRRYRKDGPQSLYYFDEHLSEVAKPSAFNDFYSRGYTGHEHLDAFGLINRNGRLYDPIVGRMLSPDPYVPDGGYTQDFNRYSYARNNPLAYVDPTGEIAWFVPMIIGAAIGAISGALIGHSNGATGWEMSGYIAGGNLIGGVSGGAAAGVAALGGAAWWAGAAAGALGGAGFNGLSSDWNSEAILKGAIFGAISGFAGGGIASVMGGGLGAAVGGATSNLTNQVLYNGGFKDINWISVGFATAMSYGMHHGMQYLQYTLMGGKAGLQDVTYKQFSKMNTTYQRSRFWRREYGLLFIKKETVRMFRGEKYKVVMRAEKNEFYSAHTHWAREGIDLGDGEVTVGGYHSDQDLLIRGYSTVIGRTTSTYFIDKNQGYQTINPDPFMRFFLFQVFNLKKR